MLIRRSARRRKRATTCSWFQASHCVGKILKSANYEGVVGVACGEELKLAVQFLGNEGVAGQSVPLIKNGCSSTVFNMDTLAKTL